MPKFQTKHHHYEGEKNPPRNPPQKRKARDDDDPVPFKFSQVEVLDPLSGVQKNPKTSQGFDLLQHERDVGPEPIEISKQLAVKIEDFKSGNHDYSEYIKKMTAQALTTTPRQPQAPLNEQAKKNESDGPQPTQCIIV